ncbi:MAG: hypothetical protein R3D57_12475 [Hyphomicrobiaceae bacterium]
MKYWNFWVRFVTGLALMMPLGVAQAETTFTRIPTQFIAALATPDAKAGTGAEQWGLWRVDPGPRGVRLRHLEALMASGGAAPAGWQFDAEDWWLEEHGLIMEAPEFPMPPGRYLVTGNRETTTVLTVFAKDETGAQRWELANGATIYDVTHLRCRSARYKPKTGASLCTPAKTPRNDFPIAPDVEMPMVDGCSKQDYAVLFIVGVADETK